MSVSGKASGTCIVSLIVWISRSQWFNISLAELIRCPGYTAGKSQGVGKIDHQNSRAESNTLKETWYGHTRKIAWFISPWLWSFRFEPLPQTRNNCAKLESIKLTQNHSQENGASWVQNKTSRDGIGQGFSYSGETVCGIWDGEMPAKKTRGQNAGGIPHWRVGSHEIENMERSIPILAQK